MSWLILVDQDRDFSNADTPHKVMNTRDYLSRPQLFRETKPKIINLARSYGYQGTGYYCALLAEARGHRIMPTVESMTELSRKTLYEHALPELEASLRRCLEKSPGRSTEATLKFIVCFGQIEDSGLTPFARLLFDWFRVPILRVNVNWNGKREIERITPAAINSINEHERAFFTRALEEHSKGTWKRPKARDVLKYTLAVLVDTTEKDSPSDQQSLRHLSRLAEKFSIDVDPIQKGDLDRVAEFDALWIRATTSIDNFTYRFARRAQQEGMPVIDDPQSMIRCTNKVYLAERLGAAGVPTPKTMIVQSEKQSGDLVHALGLPIVLKIPDGSFSRGVFKLDHEAALRSKIKEMLEHSDLLIAQEFVPTSFDWRIGVLGGEAIFACQYRMARGHWQVVKYRDGKSQLEGGFTAIPLDQVPHGVIETAVKGANLMGDGLYGVDMKQTDKGLHIIEINDNPDVNHGVEDAAEKDRVWEKILGWFWERLEA
jgi:glutathione synthase/RimK-type ligase-like ATP-grasp enzyme